LIFFSSPTSFSSFDLLVPLKSLFYFV
jgi:hypothetical protein